MVAPRPAGWPDPLDGTGLPEHVKDRIRASVDAAPEPSEALLARLGAIFQPAVEDYWRRVDARDPGGQRHDAA